MNEFTTKQKVLLYCYAPEAKQIEKIDRFLRLLDQSGVAAYLKMEESKASTGRPHYDIYSMFATIVYGFALGRTSLRELEDACRNDVRFMYIMGDEKPDYSSFSNFMNRFIKPHRDEIFACVTSQIYRECGLSMDDCFIDGTKIEADANKYKAVWKPTTFHNRLDGKVRSLLSDMGLLRGVPAEGFVQGSTIADRLKDAEVNLMKLSGKEAEVYAEKITSLFLYMEKVFEYEEKERICGPDRNSYFKTDHDATAMCLKADYYSGLGTNMHAAYQIQAIVASGLVASYYVSQDRVDIYTFTKAFERFHRQYNRYPKRICADAGYGCLENYEYCKSHGIEGFLKFQSWEGEKSGRRPAVYELNADSTITCLGERTGYITEIPGRHHKYKDTVFFKVEGCTGCAFMPYCRQFMNEKTGDDKVFEVNIRYQTLKQEARDLLLSVDGIELRVNRSCQNEGVFGIVKYNSGHDRMRRTGMAQVEMEEMLLFLGLNTRKFMRFCDSGKLPVKYWSAPKGTQPEKYKKPSAKRLANRMNKRSKTK